MKFRPNSLAIMICILLWQIILFSNASAQLTCSISPPEGPVVVLKDGNVSPLWTDWSWSATYGGYTDAQAGPVLAVQFSSDWAGFELNRAASFSTHGYRLLLLSVRTDESEELFVGIRKDGATNVDYVPLKNYIPGNTGERPPADVWHHVIIPLEDLKVANATVSGVIVHSADPGTIYLDDVVIYEGLDSPIAGDPYTVKITSILDHSGDFYVKDGIIRTLRGEEGRAEIGCWHSDGGACNEENYDDKPLAGYSKDAARSDFDLPFNYQDDDTNSPGQKGILWYDGHSGYDMAVIGDIRAMDEGILCISTDNTSPSGNTPWRDTNKCPVGNDEVTGWRGFPTSWDKWHAFYIVHRFGKLQTWYLHAAHLQPNVWNQILTNGYAVVNRSEEIGTIGNCCIAGMGVHLHFELRRDGEVIDPYENEIGVSFMKDAP